MRALRSSLNASDQLFAWYQEIISYKHSCHLVTFCVDSGAVLTAALCAQSHLLHIPPPVVLRLQRTHLAHAHTHSSTSCALNYCAHNRTAISTLSSNFTPHLLLHCINQRNPTQFVLQWCVKMTSRRAARHRSSSRTLGAMRKLSTSVSGWSSS